MRTTDTTLSGRHFDYCFTGGTAWTFFRAIPAHALDAVFDSSFFVNRHILSDRFRCISTFGTSRYSDFFGHSRVTGEHSFLGFIGVIATEPATARRKTEGGHSAESGQKKVFHDGRYSKEGVGVGSNRKCFW